MRYAFVISNLIDLWDEPRFNSERVSQLFLGEPLEVTSTRKGFCRVRQTDGYSGWADSRQLAAFSSVKEYQKYAKGTNAVVAHGPAKLYAGNGRTAVDPFFLYYGTPLRVTGRHGTLTTVNLSANRKVYIKTQRIRRLTSRTCRDIVGADLVREAKKFLGVPYLWGGISPAGFDCSGLVQTVCGCFGLKLPRDTKDQINSGVEISRDKAQSGDLLFFKRHVGLSMGGSRMIHSSVGGGGVRINSLRIGDDDYRKDLDDSFATARRIL